MALLSLYDTARILGCKPIGLYLLRYREEIGLPCVRLGRNLKFDERDLEKAIQANRECLSEKTEPRPAKKKKAERSASAVPTKRAERQGRRERDGQED
jgi:hypothetical protein